MPAPVAAPSPPPSDLRTAVAELDWYHSLELPGGVVTPGWFDTRPALRHVPLPARLDGLRCLDVGTWDGFWAFELERRGAAEVVAIDLDDPTGWDWPARERLCRPAVGPAILDTFKRRDAAFRLAREALGSRVERRDRSVYALDAERDGRFDLVFLGSLLLHLRDPVGALERLRSVCAGELVVADTIELLPTLLRPRTPSVRLDGYGKPWWWLPNRAALRRMVESAGFEVLDASGVYFVPPGPAHPRMGLREAPRRLLSAEGREELVVRARGIPHAAFRARPLDGD